MVHIGALCTKLNLCMSNASIKRAVLSIVLIQNGIFLVHFRVVHLGGLSGLFHELLMRGQCFVHHPLEGI